MMRDHSVGEPDEDMLQSAPSTHSHELPPGATMTSVTPCSFETIFCNCISRFMMARRGNVDLRRLIEKLDILL
eukprot:2494400-Prorocentrum_lima.AAC.1